MITHASRDKLHNIIEAHGFHQMENDPDRYQAAGGHIITVRRHEHMYVATSKGEKIA